jgi:hypothetical protein
MRTFAVALLLVLLTIPSRADTRAVIKTTFAGQETIYAQYVQGKNMRTEDLSPDGSRRPVTIWNWEQKTMYQLDLQSEEYVERGPHDADWILSVAGWIARPPRIHESGKIVNIYFETIDTGERREFFGRSAKHLLVRERHVAEPGACDQTRATEKDGWYIPRVNTDTEAAPYLLVSYTGFITGMCHDTLVKHGVQSLPGFPVLETDGSITREILEFSNDALDKSLFQVPSGFKKVDALPGYPSTTWFERLENDWRVLVGAFESRFEQSGT